MLILPPGVCLIRTEWYLILLFNYFISVHLLGVQHGAEHSTPLRIPECPMGATFLHRGVARAMSSWSFELRFSRDSVRRYEGRIQVNFFAIIFVLSHLLFSFRQHRERVAKAIAHQRYREEGTQTARSNVTAQTTSRESKRAFDTEAFKARNRSYEHTFRANICANKDSEEYIEWRRKRNKQRMKCYYVSSRSFALILFNRYTLTFRNRKVFQFRKNIKPARKKTLTKTKMNTRTQTYHLPLHVVIVNIDFIK